jgi:acetyl-CoA carboxylase biotin carboxyl carrier protein
MKLVEQSSFDELTLEMEGIKLTLRRGAANGAGGAPAAAGASHADADGSAAPASAGSGAGATRGANIGAGSGATAGVSPAISPSSAAPASTGSSADAARGVSASAGAGSAAGGAPAAPVDPNVKDVPAPLLGTFYRQPKPGAPPFVEVGSAVEEDTVVAIIEVMKLMNTVRAGVRGTVTEILARDGTLVEYGETLLRVRKAG